MNPVVFNPFQDRLSRDIRNDLSEAIVHVLANRSLDKAKMVAETYLKENLAEPYAEYIHTRLDRYGQALDHIQPHTSLLHQAAVLWNLQLLFEVHEILEPAWIAASGNRKLILQALIRAVGVYINLEQGYQERAAKIASKALPVLKKLKTEVAHEIDIDELVAAIEALTPTPPRILRKN